MGNNTLHNEEIAAYQTFSAALPTTDPKAAPRSQTASVASLLDSLVVPLRVELGTVTLSVEELLDLLPGQQFRFPIPQGARLSLYSGENCLGEASLIERDGGLYLCIEELLSEQIHPAHKETDNTSQQLFSQTCEYTSET